MLESQQAFEKIYLQLSPENFKLPEADLATAQRATIERIDHPTYEEYREWHDLVGRPYNWHTRSRVNDRAAIEELLAKEGTEMCVFKIDDQIIGYSLTGMASDMRVEVSDFGFPPDKVGQGYGTIFFPMVIDRLIKQGAQKIWLSTRSTNDPRVPQFYERFGFSIYDRQTVSGEQH